MSYFRQYWQKSTTAKAEHEKAWKRDKAVAWDEKWQALSHSARDAYLNRIKAPVKEGSVTQPNTLADKVPAAAVAELVAAGFAAVEPGRGNRGAKILPLSAAYDFSSRLRAIQRYDLPYKSSRDDLAKYVKYAFYNQGEIVINDVLTKANVEDTVQLDEGLELYVTTRRWPDWAMESIKSKAAKPLLDALRKAEKPVRLVDLPDLVKASPAEVREALADLVVHLVAFEGVKPDTLELTVGLLPSVRRDLVEAAKPRNRPPLVVREDPKEVGPPGGLEVNDLRVFLLEVAGEAPRLRQDGGIFQKEEARFLEALPPLPAWLDQFLETSPGRRISLAYRYSRIFDFVERESEDKATVLRLSGKGRKWLSSSIEEQYARVYEYFSSTNKKKNVYEYDYDGYGFGDSKFLGVAVSVMPSNSKDARYYNYYTETKPERRDMLRVALRKGLESLPVGVFHRLDSVIDHLAFGEHNPLLAGSDPSKVIIYLDRRQVPRLPEQVELAGKLAIEVFFRLRLIPFDAFRTAIDAEGEVCVARQPRLDGYFGLPYDAGRGEESASTKVIVQPDFSVLVIGLDPAPAAELAPFCERAGGAAGQGALTFKITRDSVIRAASQGLSGQAIVDRLRKYASVDVPENVLREIREWAGWIRLVNVRPITVVRCPDRETVARVASGLGKKAEPLGDTLVALHVPKLTPADRQKLQEQGILVVKEDIAPAKPAEPAGPSTPAPPSGKKRGRPKKAR